MNDSAEQSGNSLGRAASSYLRSAAHQPVHWHEWGAEAFEQASREDKPVLLDIGAVWCHWCHVMDRESYEDPALAAIINENFIAVKVDRDERPDVDSRYQMAVQAISGQGGWPLTAFLTPDGRPYFGGTYFPREARYGRAAFDHVLRTMADAWKTQRGRALDAASQVFTQIESGESFAGHSGPLSLNLVDSLVGSALHLFDAKNGGFGEQPKFPHPAAIDLLLDVAGRTGSETARHAALFTLEKMSRGGVYDQLAGGFHRYSVDEQWIVPHFEKMLSDNVGLLANYVHAFQSFVDADAAWVARDIMRWLDTVMTDRERGGFYASQDADLSLDDDGDYFTWTRDEAAAVLTPDEMAVAEPYYDIGEIGDMHHNPAKNVLHRNFTIEEVAAQTGRKVTEVQALLVAAKDKLLTARLARPTPFIDRTIYTAWNAMAVSAYLAAAQVLELKDVRGFALKTLDRLLAEGWSAQTGLRHVVAYPDGTAGPHLVGVLEDYAFLTHALLDGWEATGERRYYDSALGIGKSMIARFYDETGGGFFDAEVPTDSLGVMAARRKPLQDASIPAGNPVAAAALLRLEALSERADFHEKAEQTLATFAGVVDRFGLYAGSYGLALELFLLPPAQVVIIGTGPEARKLAAMATARYAVNKRVIVLRPEQVTAENLPPALAETLPHLPGLADGHALATVCQGSTCQPPTRDGQTLLEALSAV